MWLPISALTISLFLMVIFFSKKRVDNKEVKPKIALNSLMAIDCEEGTHKIKLEYKSNYLIPTIISIITFIGLIMNIIYKQLKKKNE